MLVQFCVSSETAARKLAKATLAKRTSAERRIGVEYQCRELVEAKDLGTRLLTGRGSLDGYPFRRSQNQL